MSLAPPIAWHPDEGPARLRAALRAHGFARVVMGPVARDAALDPWGFAARLLGATPRMVERQPIRAVSGGRSFASSDVYTPLHTDSQQLFGAPPDAQVMVCARASEVGGETLLVDAWSLAERLMRDDPALFDALVHAPRRMPFVFGDVYGPTLSLRGGALAFTHTPAPVANDPVAARLAPLIDQCPRWEFRVETGEVMVVDNRRMLHGRRAFGDPRREFVRLLVWTESPLGDHPALQARAAEASAMHTATDTPAAARRLAVVLEMLRGAPPGMLAAREGVPESDLYRWRDAALRGALGAL